jgi:hypothetical protein
MYTVRLSALAQDGKVATWQLVVRVYPRLRPAIAATRVGPRTWRLTARVRGGDGAILRRDWSFAGGRHASGRTVTRTFAPGAAPSATLTVADATTTAATAGWHVR